CARRRRPGGPANSTASRVAHAVLDAGSADPCAANRDASTGCRAAAVLATAAGQLAGQAAPATAGDAALTRAFVGSGIEHRGRCLVRVLWSSRPVDSPTIADGLAVPESPPVEGGVPGPQLPPW